MSYRICNICKVQKELSEFYTCSKEKLGKQYKCKVCDKLYHKKRREDPTRHEKDKVYQRVRSYIRQYGLSEEEALSLVENRVGECEICGSLSPLEIDHCHTTNNLRGKLCHTCNTGIGLLRDNPKILESAILYLRRYSN